MRSSQPQPRGRSGPVLSLSVSLSDLPARTDVTALVCASVPSAVPALCLEQGKTICGQACQASSKTLPPVQAPLRTMLVGALRHSHGHLAVPRVDWAPVSRVLAADLPNQPDELPTGTGARMAAASGHSTHVDRTRWSTFPASPVQLRGNVPHLLAFRGPAAAGHPRSDTYVAVTCQRRRQLQQQQQQQRQKGRHCQQRREQR